MLVQLAHFAIIACCLLLSVPYGRYMARVFTGERNLLTLVLQPVERVIYRVCGVDEKEEMTWKTYLLTLVVFNVIGFIFLFALLTFQGWMPLNPQNLSSFRWDTALNVATSFVTNTEWQVYSGERDFSYLSQILGLIVQDFISPSVGLVCAIALFRGFGRKGFNAIGNFWVDMTRSIFYIILPLVLVFSFFLISQGVIQNLSPYTVAQTLEGKEQLIPGGPAAGLTALQIICEDGGGFFNVNCIHPFATPTPLSYFLEMGIMLLIPSALCFTFGEMLQNRKIGRALFIGMLVLFLLSIPFYLWAEPQGNPILAKLGVAGGVNLEGKEMRFTEFEAMLWTVTSMCPANGSILAQHDSLLPLSMLAIITNLVIGAPIFGCWGSGINTMLFYFILTVFVGGLMTGRSPDMAGKKIEPLEIILSAASLLSSSLPTLVLGGIAIALPVGLAGLNNAGPHGLTEILYNVASVCINNGSPAAGLATNTVFYNLMLSVGMILGRYSTLVAALWMAGSLARKKMVAESPATLSVGSPFFMVMVVGTVVIVSALTFFPVLMLGPFLEHLLMQLGKTF
jgi:K+-transporting ATPase ATPase A chain